MAGTVASGLPWWQSTLAWLVFDPSRQPPAATQGYFSSPPNHVFCLGGRFRTAKNTRYINALTFIAIIIPLVLFLVFEALWAWRTLSPAVPLVFIYTWVATAGNFIRAASSDPGVLPRTVHPVEGSFPEEYSLAITVPAFGTGAVEMKYCTTCLIWRPARASHCAICNTCVLIHDHHCIWLNNCVGQRNYMYFMGFLGWSVVCCAYLIAYTVYRLTTYSSFRAGVRHTPATLALLIYGGLVLAYPALLFGLHLFLNLTGQTTREFLGNMNSPPDKRTFKRYAAPGVFRNALLVWFRVRAEATYRVRQKQAPRQRT